jgi:hypothetical protein
MNRLVHDGRCESIKSGGSCDCDAQERLIIGNKIVGKITPLRLWSAWQVSKIWRIQQRLPRLTKLANELYKNVDRPPEYITEAQ